MLDCHGEDTIGFYGVQQDLLVLAVWDGFTTVLCELLAFGGIVKQCGDGVVRVPGCFEAFKVGLEFLAGNLAMTVGEQL